MLAHWVDVLMFVSLSCTLVLCPCLAHWSSIFVSATSLSGVLISALGEYPDDVSLWRVVSLPFCVILLRLSHALASCPWILRITAAACHAGHADSMSWVSVFSHDLTPLALNGSDHLLPFLIPFSSELLWRQFPNNPQADSNDS